MLRFTHSQPLYEAKYRLELNSTRLFTALVQVRLSFQSSDRYAFPDPSLSLLVGEYHHLIYNLRRPELPQGYGYLYKHTWHNIAMTSHSDPDPLPFWLVNVPRDSWPSTCPDFLSACSEKDKEIIGTPDSQYTLLTWEQVKEVVRTYYPRLSFHS
jgi:hypothetical protein